MFFFIQKHNTFLEGPDGAFAGCRRGTLVIDMSTVDPGTSQAMADRARALGLRYLEAPVTGGVGAAEQGTLNPVGINCIRAFGAMGITARETMYFLKAFEEGGKGGNVGAFINQADDPAIERIFAPRCALTVAEYLAFEKGYQVLVVLTDMTNYCEALREIAAARPDARFVYTADDTFFPYGRQEETRLVARVLDMAMRTCEPPMSALGAIQTHSRRSLT